MTKLIFVFGSNLAGRHGAGSALHARIHFGARPGVGEGRTGSAYAIPTKDAHLHRLPLACIAGAIARFRGYAKAHPELTFQIVKIGCGLAGFTEAEIAPFFIGSPPNCSLPPKWREWKPSHDPDEEKAQTSPA
jgi:hypothetical protein